MTTAPYPFACPECGEPIEQRPSGWWAHVGLPNGCWRLSLDGPCLDFGDIDDDATPDAIAAAVESIYREARR